MFITTLLLLSAVATAVAFYYLYVKNSNPISEQEFQKRIQELKDEAEREIRKKMREELDEDQKASYNEKRQRFVDRMTRLKLVYNEETDEWEKLKELEE